MLNLEQEFDNFYQQCLQGFNILKTAEQIRIGVSEKQVIYQENKLRLLHFKPLHPKPAKTPLLIVFALVNRPEILDLTEESSFIKFLLQQGIDVYLIDWGHPDSNDSNLSLNNYINDYLHNCIEYICQYKRAKKINLLGVCQGGVFSLCYSGLYPERVKKLVTISTPVDFHTKDNLLSGLVKNIDAKLLAKNNIPGTWLAQAFISLKPYQVAGKKYLRFLEKMTDDGWLKQFLALEKWLLDTPNQAGTALAEFLKDFYQRNKLLKGKIKLGKRAVSLNAINMPVLNIIAEGDYIIPPSASLPLEKYIGSKDYSAMVFPTGHIGLYVSEKTKTKLPSAIAKWLKQ